ncbi:hypothetical protein [Microseira sp. BLCC-F43]|uniref:hypothetical protein n=1 Tax=Microseira sp. BLCC-F43 TaxID=3153602 RepID=UPI0035B957C2
MAKILLPRLCNLTTLGNLLYLRYLGNLPHVPEARKSLYLPEKVSHFPDLPGGC